MPKRLPNLSLAKLSVLAMDGIFGDDGIGAGDFVDAIRVIN